jgi:hypothetical protein
LTVPKGRYSLHYSAGIAIAVMECGKMTSAEAIAAHKEMMKAEREKIAIDQPQLLYPELVPEESLPTLTVQKRAEEILATGNPMALFLDAYAHNHNGDNEILRAVIYAAALQSSTTTHGLQVFITGGKGKGKSNAIKSAITLLPPEIVINSSFSDKSLYVFLKNKIKPVIYSDDTELSPTQVQTIKRAMTNFQSPTEYRTMNAEFGLKVFSIPPRALWIGTSVTQSGDDQLRDRFVTLSIMPEAKDDTAYIQWEIERRQAGRPEIDVTEDIEVAREMIKLIRGLEYKVKNFKNIRFKYSGDRRLVNICLDLIEASAIINHRQREHTLIDNVMHVTPNADDLAAALDFTMFRMTDESAEGRLTRSERALDEKIQGYIGKGLQIELTEREIVDIYGKTHNAVRVLLYGREGTQHTITGGLLEKCPWYRLDRQEMTNGRTGQSVIVVSKHQSIKMSECTNFAVLESSLESAT